MRPRASRVSGRRETADSKTMSTFLTEASVFLPVTGYLLMVTALLYGIQRVPHWVHGFFLVVGLAARVLQSGWLEPAASAGIAALVFVVLVFLAARTVSGVTLFSIVVTLALTPLDGWPGLFAGMLVAAVVALWRTWRNLGKNRVAYLTMDTLNAIGISPAGVIKMPELGLIPERDSLTDVNTHSEEADRLRMYLPPYLLLGVGVSALLTYLV